MIGKSLKETIKETSQKPKKCQKCLESGHWTYECKGKRKFLYRSSRSSLLHKKLKALEDKEKHGMTSAKQKKVVRKGLSKKSDSSSSSSSGSSSSSDSSDSSSSESETDSSSSSDSSAESE